MRLLVKNMIAPIICISALLIPALGQTVTVLYEWKYLNFTWSTEAAYSEALKSGSYIPKNNLITGIKVWKDQVYLTLPRWKKGVPATLVVVPKNSKDNEYGPLLRPYPNWEMQEVGNCSALQYVQSMEIDTKGRMWTLENGRTEWSSEHERTECPSRLYIFDLEDGGKILLNYRFPDNVVQRNSVFLNDIVLDHENGGWAYISDSDSEFPGIVVFSLKDKKSWKVVHSPSMSAPSAPVKIPVNDKVIEFQTPIDGIALSPASSKANRIVYYTPLSSYVMFTIPVRVLKNPRHQAKHNVKSIGKRSSISDGLMITAKGNLYYGLLTEDSLAKWPISARFFSKKNQEIVFRNATTNQWPDTFAIDETGRLWWTTNRIPRFEADEVNLNESNYRVLFTDIKDRSYMYYSDFSKPNFPNITL